MDETTRVDRARVSYARLFHVMTPPLGLQTHGETFKSPIHSPAEFEGSGAFAALYIACDLARWRVEVLSVGWIHPEQDSTLARLDGLAPASRAPALLKTCPELGRAAIHPSKPLLTPWGARMAASSLWC